MHENAQHATGGHHNWRIWLNELLFQCFQWVCDFFVLTASQQQWAKVLTSTLFSAQLMCYIDFVLCLIHAGVLVGFILLSLCSIWMMKVDFWVSFAHVHFLSKVHFKVSVRQMCCDPFDMFWNPDVATVDVRRHLSMLCLLVTARLGTS